MQKEATAATADASRPPANIADGRYVSQQKLGNGAFAQIWRGCDTVTKEPVAIKFEDYRDQELMLEDEAELMQQLASPSRAEGFARCLHYGDEGPWQCLVMELLGASLEDQLRSCGGRLCLQSVLLVAEQALQRIEYLHSKGFVHRDIKPENFLFGVGSRIHHLYLIDFGLSKRYYTEKGHEQLGSRKVGGLAGTARYASINALRGVPQSRRDDLEALGYVLAYLLRGSLPWSGLQRPTAEAVLERKAAVKPRELCRGLPTAFKDYLTSVRALGFDEQPDYRSLRGLFRAAREEHGPAEDHRFEWLANQPLGTLVPLEPWEEGPLQPDGRKHSWPPWGGLLSARWSAFLAATSCNCCAEAGDSSDSNAEDISED